MQKSSPGTIANEGTSSTRSRGSLLRAVVVLFFFVIALGGGAFAYGRHWLLEWSKTPRQLPAPIETELSKGMALVSLSKQLEQQGLITNGRAFQIWIRYFGSYDRFQAGLYRFEQSVSPSDIAATMVRGETYTPVVFQITVPEGATLRQIAERLAAGGVAAVEEIIRKAKEPSFLQSVGIEAKSAEGYLYPATYPFAEIPTPEAALRVMIDRFWKVLPADYEGKASERGLTLSQAVTFASLIELETAVDEERVLISEVIWNRLNRKLPLGIDAALIYGIEDYQGDITWKHLRDEANPYNTRVHAGLPPSPIASPSSQSLLAVLSPSNFGYLYYVVDADIPTRHRFAKTLAEHNRNVRAFLKRRPQR